MARALTIVLVAVSLATTAQAQIVPPPGFDSWIYQSATHCIDPPVTGMGACAGSATGFLAIENREASTHIEGIIHIGGGSIFPNRMTAFSESNANSQTVLTSLQDTYTLSGPPGDVEITARLTAEADAMRLPALGGQFGGQPLGGLTFGIRIGDGIDPSGLSLFNSIGDFDELPIGLGPLSKLLSAEVLRPMTVTANEPFLLAYQMVLQNTIGARGDARNTAVIGFDIPPGYTLTSELGWTPIPEPTTLVLLSTGVFALLGATRRRSVLSYRVAGAFRTL